MKPSFLISLIYITISLNPLLAQKVVSDTIIKYDTFFGKWGNSGWIYKSELVLNKNKTFKYRYSACTKELESEGNWHIEGQFLILTSWPQYSKERKSNSKSRLQNLYLNKEKYLIKSDSLIRVNTTPYLSASKFKKV